MTIAQSKLHDPVVWRWPLRVLVAQSATWLVLQACGGFHAGFRRHIAAAARRHDADVCKIDGMQGNIEELCTVC